MHLPAIFFSEEKTKHEENSQINGITNTAFTVDNADADIYEVRDMH
mgnify:CR=1 FL=1